MRTSEYWPELDLMAGVKLNMPVLEAEHTQTAKAMDERTLTRLRDQRGLVTAVLDANHREILWAHRGCMAFSVVETRHLLPSKLTE